MIIRMFQLLYARSSGAPVRTARVHAPALRRGLVPHAAALAEEQTWRINVKNADLNEFVVQVAEITGKPSSSTRASRAT